MFNVIENGNVREYDFLGDIMIDPVGRSIQMRPYHAYEVNKDGAWTLISYSPCGDWISISDRVRIDPETFAADPDGEPAYSLLESRFKPLIEGFAASVASGAQAQQATEAEQTQAPDHMELPEVGN